MKYVAKTAVSSSVLLLILNPLLSLNPSTVPKDYDKLLSHYTHKGYRVIACASRHLNTLSWVKAQKMTRGEVESDLTFVGFIIFENKLKSNTAGVIAELIESNINAVMVTGDNILTAISVARECGLVDRNTHCFTPRFVTGELELGVYSA